MHVDPTTAVLRRPYTRTIAKDIRPVPVLAASFADAKQQWRDLVLERRHVDIQEGGMEAGRGQHSSQNAGGADNLLDGTKPALVALEMMASQLKAVKQELVVHLNEVGRRREDGELGSSAPPQERRHGHHRGEGVDSEEVRFFVKLASSPPRLMHSGEDHTSKSTVADTLLLARRVWLWSILVGCTLADLDLLSGSLSTAQQELFSEAEEEVRAPESPIEREACELEEFFFPLPTRRTAVSATATRFSIDAVFALACSLLYNVMTNDVAAAARALQRWSLFTASLTEKLRHGTSTTTTAAAAASPKEEDSPHVRMEEAALLLMMERCVSALAVHLVAEDYGSAGAVLQTCAEWCRTAQADEHVEDPKAHEHGRLAASFLLGIQLLLRMLLELDTRRGLVTSNVGSSYRPVIATNDPASGAGGAAMTSLASCILASAGQHVECVHCRTDPPSALREDTDGCLAHWPRRIQLRRLLDVGGPWPLPPDVVKSQFSFLLRL